MKPRYQFFISSTFKDLEEERDHVMKAILELNHFPAGMELFPAADDSQMKYIERIIEDSDYYIVIIAGRYGSVNKSGVSYTEQEFDYAVKLKKPILAFLHKNVGSLPSDKCDKDSLNLEKLRKFVDKVRTGRLVRTYENKHELSAIVSRGIHSLIESHPSTGWIKRDKYVSGEESVKLYTPTQVFLPTDTSSVEFNLDLTTELRRSKIYLFRGVSGKRCAVRLKSLKNNPNEITMRFIMPHPNRDDEFLDERVSHRMRARNEYDFPAQKKRMQEDIHMSILWMFDIKLRYKSCEIVFQRSPSISRMEIFDHAVYLSLYDSNIFDRKYNPPIVKYDDSSIFLEYYRQEALRELEFRRTDGDRIVIDRTTTFDTLVKMFELCEPDPLDEKSYYTAKEKFNAFEAQFLTISKVGDV